MTDDNQQKVITEGKTTNASFTFGYWNSEFISTDTLFC